MLNTIIISLQDDHTLALHLANTLQIEMGKIEIDHFPDSEIYVRILSDVKHKNVILIDCLAHPNHKLLTLIFAAKTLKELGANKICLITSYLPYMRQDKHFKAGDANTSVLFANLISECVDQLITIDPHLHRIKNLSEIYKLESTAVIHSTKKIAEWINNNVHSPLIIGPDEESQQWVEEIAAYTQADYIICKKTRYGHKDVEVSVPKIKYTDRTPIIVDDIISSGASVLAILRQISAQGFKNAICIGIHALFSHETYQTLLHHGASEIVTCNTIKHPTNRIDINDLIVEQVKQLITS